MAAHGPSSWRHALLLLPRRRAGGGLLASDLTQAARGIGLLPQALPLPLLSEATPAAGQATLAPGFPQRGLVLRGFAAGGGPSPAVQAKEEAEEQSKAEGGRTTPMTREVMDTQASQQRAAEDSAVREAAAVAAARRTEELARREQEIEDALFHELDRCACG